MPRKTLIFRVVFGRNCLQIRRKHQHCGLPRQTLYNTASFVGGCEKAGTEEHLDRWCVICLTRCNVIYIMSVAIDKIPLK